MVKKNLFQWGPSPIGRRSFSVNFGRNYKMGMVPFRGYTKVSWNLWAWLRCSQSTDISQKGTIDEAGNVTATPPNWGSWKCGRTGFDGIGVSIGQWRDENPDQVKMVVAMASWHRRGNAEPVSMAGEPVRSESAELNSWIHWIIAILVTAGRMGVECGCVRQRGFHCRSSVKNSFSHSENTWS